MNRGPRRLQSIFAAIALSLWAGPAFAEGPVRLADVLESPGDLLPDALLGGFRLGDGYALTEDSVEAEEEDAAVTLPPFRLELSARMVWDIGLKFKKGRAGSTGSMQLHKDFHLPDIPHYGFRILFEARVHEDLQVGGEYGRVFLRWPRRVTHDTGQTVSSNTIPPAVRGRAGVDLQSGHVFVRHVVRDNERVRFSFGVGALWASFRFSFRGRGGARLDGVVEDFFAPTLTYVIHVQIVERFYLYLESMSALLSVTKFPAYVTEFRLGARILIAEGIEVFLAANSFSGQLEDLTDLYGGKSTSTHQERRASWTVLGLELGTSFRF